MELFVPGRICILGEHSDWAGGYRRINSDIEKGFAIVAGTNQGIYAEVTLHPTKLILHTHREDGQKKDSFEIEMNSQLLLEKAQEGEFYSYACGVAHQILTHYNVRGLVIDNYKTDIPIKKGLSSSAAICVLVARAFNRVYDLKMTVRGEMEYAYQGEINTPSRCGRMDQGCAYGSKPILMTFDGDRIEVEEIKVPKDLYFVIVDLKAGKDTKEILAKLNRCYPFAEDDLQKKVHRYLGSINKQVIQKGKAAIEQGNAEELGSLMREAQTEFDMHLMPACPSQLKAPILHKLLQFKSIQNHIFGGKGVGSQGDGTGQLLAKDEKSQKRVMEIVENELNMSCLPLVIRSSRALRKAVIPAAGFGTRLFPASKAIKKELFPIIDGTGRAKPVILAIVEELVNSGIEEVAIIIQKRDQKLFEDLFFAPPHPENFNKLSKEDQEYSEYLLKMGKHVSFLLQEVQEGFGHAVYCAHEWVGDEPFLLTLGDYLFTSTNDISCTRQLLKIYEHYNTNVVGLKHISKEDLKSFGCVAGMWKKPGSILEISEFAEKPSVEYAEEHLTVDGINSNTYLALFGQYILSPMIFHLLKESIDQNRREQNEFQLTSCLDRLRSVEGFLGYLVKGKSYDIGMPEKYRQTMRMSDRLT